ncbi:flagellin N-terminal helical domain-containing protein [Halobacillus faecis]
MRINHNIAALNTHRQLGQANNANQNSMEKLSSGLRINNASDDAAGLAISEKMRGQIRGLDQAQRNAQDGISLIQTAEGALNETHDILQRMRELATQSANDTNTETDRGEIQKEVDQLSEELTRIADNTEFNTQNLLDGSFEGKFQIGANEGQNIELSINKMNASALGVEGGEAGVKTGEITKQSTALGTSGDSVVTTDVNAEYTVEKLDGEFTAAAANMDSSSADVTANYALKDEDGKYTAISEDGKTWHFAESAADDVESIDLKGASNELANAKVTLGTNAALTDGTVKVWEDGSKQINMKTSDARYDMGSNSNELNAGEYTISTDHTMKPASATSVLLDSNNNVVASSTDETTYTDLEGNNIFTSDSAYSNGDTITVSGGGGIDVSSQASADDAITKINNAIESVSAERSKLGAYQNRLDHTINNLGTSSENLTAAESRIRDVDYALAS